MRRFSFFPKGAPRIAGAAFLAAALALGLGTRVQAQDFEHIAPKQPEKTTSGQVVDQSAKPLASSSDEEVLVNRLQGVFILSDPKQVRPEGVSSHRTIEPGDVAFAKQPDFEACLLPYLGKPVTMKDLSQMTRSIVAYYRDHDRPVVNVYVPQQSISSGFVQIVVVESRVEKVDAIGAHWFSNSLLRTEVHLRPGEPISGTEMRKDIDWINRNPFLQSDLLMAPGDKPGTTDLLLRTQDRFPVRFYAGYEDSGNSLTSNNRILTGFNYGDLFGLGQQISYQYTTAPNAHEFSAHSGTYVIPLPWQHLLTIFGSYSSSNPKDTSIPISTAGINSQISMRYEIPLPGTEHFSESVIGGFDFKQANNNILFGGTSVSNTFADTDQFVVAYQASYLDDWGSTSGSATAFISPGGLTGNDNNTDYETQREAAKADYIYGLFTFDRVTRLPMDFSWTVRGELQKANANLLPSEELGLGGYSSVRGYEEREVNGDNGFLLSTEVAAPPVSIIQLFGEKSVKDQLQFLGFMDYGGASDYLATPGVPSHMNLLGVGPALRYVISPYLSFRFDYGFQLIKTANNDGENSRGHIGVLLSY